MWPSITFRFLDDVVFSWSTVLFACSCKACVCGHCHCSCALPDEAGVWLESCEKAVAGMSGEEIWSLATDGTLVHAGSKTCLSCWCASSTLALVSCDAAVGVAKWELQGNGQVKMAQSNMCVSQVGPSGAAVNGQRGRFSFSLCKLDVRSQPWGSSGR